jgi:hypothetical protein
MNGFRGDKEEGETSDFEQEVDWQAKFRQMEARLKEAEAQNQKSDFGKHAKQKQQ